MGELPGLLLERAVRLPVSLASGRHASGVLTAGCRQVRVFVCGLAAVDSPSLSV